MIFIKSNDSILSLDGLEGVFLKKREEGFKLIFKGIGQKIVTGKEHVISLESIDDDAAKAVINVIFRMLQKQESIDIAEVLRSSEVDGHCPGRVI